LATKSPQVVLGLAQRHPQDRPRGPLQRDRSAESVQSGPAQLNRGDAKSTARQSRNRNAYNPFVSRNLGNSSQLASNFDYCSAENRRKERVRVAFQCNMSWRLKQVRLCTAIVEIHRRLRRTNAETQRFAEGRKERRKNKAFSSAFLRALCVSALRLV
jgi:hypothetical protein